MSLEALFLLSLIRLERGNYQGAIEAAARAWALKETGIPYANALARVNFRRGRAFLGLGRYPEAVEALAAADAHWQKQGAPPGATSYWYGQALIASGDRERGEAIVKAALPKLAASHMPRDRALAAREGAQSKLSAVTARQ
jgi:tetratricopeptide (TPR) repeat protein